MATQSKPPESLQPSHGRRAASYSGCVVGPVLLALGAWLMWGSEGLNLPLGKAMAIDPSRLSTAPLRDMLGDPPVINIDGFERTCMDCHRMFPPRAETPVRLMKHEHIVLDHGINDRCWNCHYDQDRNRLVLRGGRVIGFDEVVELCAKCHGPTYHDWQRGAHGRTNGYWDTTRGEMLRLQCTQCHDPHTPRVPAMEPLRPLPGPNTLRMGTPKDEGHGDFAHVRDPLRRGIDEEDAGCVPGTSTPRVP